MNLFGKKSYKVEAEPIEVRSVPGNGHFKFVVPYFDVFDPRLTDYAVPVAVHGTVVYTIESQDLFESLNGKGCTAEAFETKLRSALSKYIKGVVSNAPYQEQIPVVQLERRILQISDLIQLKVSPQVETTLGIRIQSLDVSTIIIDKDSKGYQELKSLTADLEKENVLARHNASLSNFNLQNSLQENQLQVESSLNLDSMKRQQELTLGKQEELQRIELENQKETMRIQREEMQRAARLQTEQTFIEAHKTDLQATAPTGSEPPVLPTSSPEVSYYVGINGHQAGPFDGDRLANLVRAGQIDQKTYVWKQGMPGWAHAGEVSELSSLFESIPPAFPPELPNI